MSSETLTSVVKYLSFTGVLKRKTYSELIKIIAITFKYLFAVIYSATGIHNVLFIIFTSIAGFH